MSKQEKEKIQIPLSGKLKSGLKKKASDEGFSSMNEAVRMLIHHYVNGNISVGLLQPQTPMLDLETEKRVVQSLEDYKKGDYITLDMSDPEAINKLLEYGEE